MGHDQVDKMNTYFAELNPIACKIYKDVSSIKTTYAHIWNEINYHEQCDLINETLIKPEITLRYFNTFSASTTSTVSSAISNEDRYSLAEDNLHKPLDSDKTLSGSSKVYLFDCKNVRTFCNQKTGQKLIHDDVIGMFRDEHSGPFNFKTKSQLNLSLFCNHSQLDGGGTGTTPVLRSTVNTSSKISPPPLAASTDKQLSLKYKRAAVPKEEVNSSNLKQSGAMPCLVKAVVDVDSMPNISKDFSKLALESSDECKSRFLTRFICEDNMIFNAAAGEGHHIVTDYKLNIDGDSGENKELISSCNIIQEDSLQSEDAEDYDKSTCEESRLLLNTSGYDLRKGFEFLSNW